jgi:hypothetical protein
LDIIEVELEVPLYISFALLLVIFIEAINSKALILFYHLHTRGRAWVKLGDVDACKIHA